MTTKTINVELRIDSARFSIDRMKSAIDTCHQQFEWVFPDQIYRTHQPSKWLGEAHARWLCARDYVSAIDKTDYSEANQHRAERATWVCMALNGAVKALLARAYVDLAQRHPCFKKYKALGEQALAYSQVTLGGNWEYFIPKLLIWEDREISIELEREVLRLLNWGEAALNYGRALMSQLQVMEYHPRYAQQAVEKVILKIDRQPGEEYYYGSPSEPTAYVLPRVESYMENRERFPTRKEVESEWGCYVYQEAREAAWYRMGGKWSHDHDFGQPKDRIAGFQCRRGGSGARQRRHARRTASASRAAASA